MICEICGKDSGEKPLCLPCWKATKSNEYTRCAKCGKWKKDDKPVCIACWKSATDEEKKGYAAKAAAAEKQRTAQEEAGPPPAPKKSSPQRKVASAKANTTKTAEGITSEGDNTLCAVCGENSKGKTLCYSCYEREKSGEITKCIVCEKWKNNSLPRCRDCWEAEQKGKGTDFRHKYADSPKYLCKQGTPVRSKAEMAIADFLYDNAIRFRYEPMRMIGGVEVHPDFYLEDADLILEHCGMETEEYLVKRQKREELYRANGIKYITTEKSEEYAIRDALTRKLHEYFRGKQLS